MKASGSSTLLNLCSICVLFISLLNGCSDDTHLKHISSTEPKQEQLVNSSFAQFVNKLKAIPLAQRNNLVQSILNDYPNSPVVEENGLTFFYWYGKAESVFINGDIQTGWTKPEEMNVISCGYENFFYKIYKLPADARVDYQFIINDSSITDPRNPVITESGFGFNSQCAMPLFNPKTVREYRSNIKHGTVDSILFESKLTSVKPRLLKVYIPPGYENLSQLPALYVNDGFKAVDFCSYINVLDNMIGNGLIKPVIAVFIDFVEGDQYYFLDSTSEYITAVCDELIPFVDNIYRTSKNPEDRVIAGISAGGHASLITTLMRPDVFLNSAGQSSTISTELLNLVNKFDSNAESVKKFNLYFDVGRFDLVRGRLKNFTFLYANQLLSKELKEAGIKHSFKVYNDGHQWANWCERVDEILSYFFGA